MKSIVKAIFLVPKHSEAIQNKVTVGSNIKLYQEFQLSTRMLRPRPVRFHQTFLNLPENQDRQTMKLAVLFLAASVAAMPMEPHPQPGEPGVEQADWRSSFHIQKNVDSVHEVKLKGHTCQFSYRAANTAHQEAWEMNLEESNGVFKCVIRDVDPTPPHASFYGFSAHMFGAKEDILIGDEVWDHAGQLLLGGEDYLVEGNTIRTTSHWDMRGVATITINSE